MKALTLALIATTALGTALYSPTSASAGEVANRLERQQERIYKGVQQGQISPAEYQNLQRREASINTQRQNALSDGHLSAQEYRQLNRREDRVSRSIYRDRHD
ncbi:hypothetical protein TUMEXPCC7403_18135 [Tumidithrix helvetica PCC 7403]|uniref:hypothetical protein n=1 Tax=Tumidithrix helvetica TaxID=3457545 RepID=UPI003C8908C0